MKGQRGWDGNFDIVVNIGGVTDHDRKQNSRGGEVWSDKWVRISY